MADELYELMDWAAIEAIVYSEEDKPFRTLGPHMVKGGILIQCFFPGSESVMLKTLADGKNHRMVQEDEEGFFAILLQEKEVPDYVFVVPEKGRFREYKDPYAYPLRITEEDETRFSHGICYDIYEKLGAHPMRSDKTNGVHFAVWAPNALRVSVVGDFNHWDGRMYPMERHDTSGIFELFIPGIKPGALYKFEIKLKNGLTYLKADPYANASELRPGRASEAINLKKHRWYDKEWLRQRKKRKLTEEPLFIREVDLSTIRNENGKLCTYRELAKRLSEDAAKTGYTHIELMPVMEYAEDETRGYQTSGYYAPTSRYGTPEDFMYLIDTMHQVGVGVILAWVPSYFPCDNDGLAAFDGTMLYEHQNPNQGIHPYLGTHLYNYGRPEVSNFLIANAMFWAEKYHIDGIRMEIDPTMLYLDHGRQGGQWVPNMYGGNENLEGLEFIKHLNSMMKKLYPDVLLIAKETTSWPKVTESLKNEGLGFDYKWNTSWSNDLLEYLGFDNRGRKEDLDKITFSMIYAYSERFILSLSHEEAEHKHMRALDTDILRGAYTYMTAHPGRKLLYLDAREAEVPNEVFMQQLVHLYREQPALHQLDEQPDGFVWINAIDYAHGVLSFVRHSDEQELLIVCNFSNELYSSFMTGVLRDGKYKEIFNSDNKKFGGSGNINPRIKTARQVEADGREYSIKIKLAPFSTAIFEYRKG